MQSNDGNMSLGAKVTMSAVIGGTAEKLGGGKFANGAVTGAYVMMFKMNAQIAFQRKFGRNLQKKALNTSVTRICQKCYGRHSTLGVN